MQGAAAFDRTPGVRPESKYADRECRGTACRLIPRLAFLSFILLSWIAIPARAHTLGQSYIFLRMYDELIEARLEITVADLNRALQLNIGESQRISRRDLQPHLDRIREYVEARLSIGTSDRKLPLRFTSFDVRKVEIADYVLLHYTTDAPAYDPDALEIEYGVLLDVDPAHRNLLVIEHNWKTATFNNESVVSLVFSPLRMRQTLDLSSSSVFRGLAGLVLLGTWHIWVGFDHILFLLALALPSVLVLREGQWKPVDGFRPALMNIVAIVTCFTIAHSITLTLAALDVVRLPERFVESVIAGSIAVAALHNLYPQQNVREWAIAFVFGLFHGFGFASVLAHIGLEQKYVLLSLFGFNLGVELGQIAVICAVFPLLYVFRNEHVYKNLLKYGSILLILVAGLWLAERLLDVSFFRYGRRMLRLVYRQFVGI